MVKKLIITERLTAARDAPPPPPSRTFGFRDERTVLIGMFGVSGFFVFVALVGLLFFR